MGEVLLDRYVYLLVVTLLAIGLYGMLAAPNLVKKIIGMIIFQTAIYLFFIEGSVKDDATAPIIDEATGTDPSLYVNPLPHLLILTAIVVGVGVVGVAFALLMRIQEACGTLEEAEVIARLVRPDHDTDTGATGTDTGATGTDPAGTDPAGTDPADTDPADRP
jgi:multicomponent Na+:H+ antiporter subunit C